MLRPIARPGETTVSVTSAAVPVLMFLWPRCCLLSSSVVFEHEAFRGPASLNNQDALCILNACFAVSDNLLNIHVKTKKKMLFKFIIHHVFESFQ